jgi:hypothetical protein
LSFKDPVVEPFGLFPAKGVSDQEAKAVRNAAVNVNASIVRVEGQVHEPEVFIAVLREFHEAARESRGRLANSLSELIIRKRVDLAAVRHYLLERGDHELTDTLDRLIDLIEPYIEEGGVDE